MKLVLYSSSMNRIGGIETFNYNWCKRMSKFYDITFVYESGDIDRLKNLAEYVTVTKFTGKTINCDICIWSTAWGLRPEHCINAKEYWQMIHADYNAYIKDWHFTYTKLPKVTKHIAVGKHVAEAFTKVTGYKVDYILYNLLDNQVMTSRNKLRLVAATRISKEKGIERLLLLAKKLKKHGVDFVLDVYGDTPTSSYKDEILLESNNIPEIVWHGSKLNITREIENAHYLLVLSDTEGCPYSLMESLQVGTPVICTDFPAAKEHIIDGKNGYILDMKLSNLDIDKIINHIPKDFKYKEKTSEKDWIKAIGSPDGSTSKPCLISEQEIKVQPLEYNNKNGTLLGY
jgi:glycosyltransferase involved in cell wall biosynthesis